MKLEQNKTKVMQVRVTPDQWRLLNVASKSIGLTPSKLIRMYVDQSCMAIAVEIKKGGHSIEDFESILNNQL